MTDITPQSATRRCSGGLLVTGLMCRGRQLGAACPFGLPPIYKVLVMSHLRPSYSLSAHRSDQPTPDEARRRVTRHYHVV
jgi:hypothetical protein